MRKLTVGIIGAVIVFFLAHNNWQDSFVVLETWGSKVLYPFLVVQQTVTKPLKQWLSARKSQQELELLVTCLQQERHNLMAENITLHAALNYTQCIKELEDFEKNYQVDQKHTVHIVFKEFSEQGHYFLIDAGSQKGICQDMVAIYKNCLIGRVTQVYPYYSKVTLISDKTCNVAAFCANTKACGIFHGDNMLDHARLDFIDHLQTLEPHDLVLSSGEGLIFPRGFALGSIKEFVVDGAQYRIGIEPLIDLRSLEYCSIIQKGAVS